MSHVGETKYKYITLLLKNEVNVFSKIEDTTSTDILKIFFKYLKNQRNGEENKSIYVSLPCPIKHKTPFVKIELNAFSNSNRRHFYGHFEKKLFKYLKN